MGNGINLRSLVKAVTDVDKIITPKLEPWIIMHGDDAVKARTAEVIKRLMTTEPRVRSGSFSASSAGSCHRAQVYGYQGHAQGVVDAQLANIFRDGKWRHLRWQAMLLDAGLLTDIEDPLVWKSKRSVGTMDGSGVVYDDHPRHAWRGMEYGFELKGVSTFQFQKIKKDNSGPLDKHLRQVSRYFLMGGFGLFIIIYEDKTTQEYLEWVVEPEPELIEEQRAELITLNDAVDRKKLPPQLPECAVRKGAFRDCSYGGVRGVCETVQQWKDVK